MTSSMFEIKETEKMPAAQFHSSNCLDLVVCEISFEILICYYPKWIYKKWTRNKLNKHCNEVEDNRVSSIFFLLYLRVYFLSFDVLLPVLKALWIYSRSISTLSETPGIAVNIIIFYYFLSFFLHFVLFELKMFQAIAPTHYQTS